MLKGEIMKKSILLALALSLSSSALATEIDGLAYEVGIDGTLDDSGSLCRVIKASQLFKNVICYKVSKPIFMVKDGVEGIFSLSKLAKSPTSIAYKYSFGDKSFEEEIGGFFRMGLQTDSTKSPFSIGNIYLDPVSKYETGAVVILY